jgi:hypothetical protein
VINNNQIQASFSSKPSLRNQTMLLNIAVLGFDIKTDVQAGENRNRQLMHDFVVLGYKTVKLSNQQGQFTVVTDLPELKQTTMKKGVALWVNQQNDQTPIQAAGNWLQN